MDIEGEIEWLYPNNDQMGYYRWSLPNLYFSRLAEDPVENLNARERIGLVESLGALFSAGKLPSPVFLELLDTFSDDPITQVQSQVVKAIQDINIQLITTELEEDYARYVRTALNPMLERIGREARPGESAQVEGLRSELLARLVFTGKDTESIAFCRKLLNTALRGVAVHDGGEALYDQMVAKLKTANLPPRERNVLLACLGSFRDEKLIQRALQDNVDLKVSPSEFLRIPSTISWNPEAQRDLFTWFQENREEIVDYIPEQTLGRLPDFFGGKDLELFLEAEELFNTYFGSNEIVQKNLRRVAATVKRNALLREKENQDLKEYLQSR
jgi:alanyl aminopeptidase